MTPTAVAVLVLFAGLVPLFLVARGLRALGLARRLASSAKLPLRDGRVALQGTLLAQDRVLHAPFSDRAAVSYRYTIGHRTLDGDAPASGWRVEAQGFVQTPTVLRTPHGDVAIRAALHAPGAEDVFDPAKDHEVRVRLRALLEGDRLTQATGPTPPVESDGSLLDAPDGALRREVATEWATPSDAKIVRRVTEGVVADGADVILIGDYRARDRALTSIAEILPRDPARARATLVRRALVGFAVAFGCAVFAAFMAFVMSSATG